MAEVGGGKITRLPAYSGYILINKYISDRLYRRIEKNKIVFALVLINPESYRVLPIAKKKNDCKQN